MLSMPVIDNINFKALLALELFILLFLSIFYIWFGYLKMN